MLRSTRSARLVTTLALAAAAAGAGALATAGAAAAAPPEAPRTLPKVKPMLPSAKPTSTAPAPVPSAGPPVAGKTSRSACDWRNYYTEVYCAYVVDAARTRALWSKLDRYSNTSNAAIAGGFALACFPFGGWPAVVCGAAGGVYGGYALDQIRHAAATGKCIAFGGVWAVGRPRPKTVSIWTMSTSTSWCTRS
jgi:hypothetical protein